MIFKKKSKRELIENHMEKYIGKIHMVFHEIASPDFHLDVYWIKTNMYGDKVNILITNGMSELEMNTPSEFKSFRFGELCIILPDDWKLSMDDFKDENNYWPIRLLKDIARFPHENDTWICMEHTIGNADENSYSENVKFNSSLIFVPMDVNSRFHTLKYRGEKINFFSVIPLYPEELQLKLDKGSDALFERLEENKINDIIDIKRINVGLN